MDFNHMTKCQRRVCGIQTSTLDAKAHDLFDLRRCGVDDGLCAKKAQEMGNHAKNTKFAR